MPGRIRDSVGGAAGEVGDAAQGMEAAVSNVCAWLSILAQRISERGIDLTIHRTDEGRFAVNVQIPQLETKEPANG